MRRWWISTKLHGRSLLYYIKYLKPVGSTVTKNTVVNTDGCIPPPQEGMYTGHLKFASEHQRWFREVLGENAAIR